MGGAVPVKGGTPPKNPNEQTNNKNNQNNKKNNNNLRAKSKSHTHREAMRSPDGQASTVCIPLRITVKKKGR